MNLWLSHGILGHGCCHVRRLDSSTLDALLVNCVHPVNKICIEFAIGIEIVSEASIHEDVNNIPKADKEIEVKFLLEATAKYPETGFPQNPLLSNPSSHTQSPFV